MARTKSEYRYMDGPIRFMARDGDWLMVRRPGCVPFCMTTKEWANLERCDRNGKMFYKLGDGPEQRELGDDR